MILRGRCDMGHSSYPDNLMKERLSSGREDAVSLGSWCLDYLECKRTS
jgi:hypothetical protein